MKTIILFFGIGLLLLSFRTPAQPKNPAYQAVAAVLDSLNVRAARADYQAYFELYAEDAIFMGTDATERWTKSAFAKWSKKFLIEVRLGHSKHFNDIFILVRMGKWPGSTNCWIPK